MKGSNLLAQPLFLSFWLCLFPLWAALVCLAGCERPAPAAREVVLYSSVDDYLLRQIIPVFEKESGITVKLVGDTEATKTTGLVERLRAESEHPRADVWWSNEPFGTMRLADLGMLEPSLPTVKIDGGWPAAFRDASGTWHGFALRARAIAYNTKRVKAEDAPASLAALTAPAWKGRVGMARPQFGTTRGQMGAQLTALGPDGYRAWLNGLKANVVRLYDGNSSVVKAVANGEVDVGLTDTDDIYAAQKERWPVARAPFGAGTDAPLLIPNTVARIKGGPHPAEAAALIDFILSERVERLHAESDSRNTPIRPALAAQFPDLALPAGAATDFAAVHKAIPDALRIWDEVFGK